MIDRAHMFDPLLEADPSFAPQWNAFLADWEDERELPHYLALSDLAHHLVAQLEAGDTQRFKAVFHVVERWHVEGDRDVREAATIGLLEDLQNAHLYRSARPQDFLKWMGPCSRRFWGKVEAFWRDGTPIAED